MGTPDVKRKLSAIFSADVEGYSRLMGEDELATVQTLTSYKETMVELIGHHRGRVVDSTGDNLLAEFASVVDAVQCAVDVQQVLKAKNERLPEGRRMRFRIGINLGDVIEEDGRIYGDGVNIAARVETLADGGGICISGTVYDQVENKLDLEYEFLGEQKVKNISKPVRTYRIESGPSPSERESTGEFEFLKRPSIAVLPFVNMSGDSEQEYFSDGLTEDLITDLSKVSGLFVIARNSAFTYKNKFIKVEEVGRELGVRYVLEGSVRKSAARVRINAQLVDAGTGWHLWAERYDRNLDDIFALQDEVTRKIIDALQVRLSDREQEQLQRSPTRNFDAYDYFLRGSAYLMRTTREANMKARQMYEKSITLDPEYAEAYVALGVTYWLDWIWQWSEDPGNLTRANELMQKAIAMDASTPQAYMTLSFIHSLQKEYGKAATEAEKAITLNPNSAEGYLLLGHILNFSRRAEEAIPLIKKAMRLNPHYPYTYLFRLAQAYQFTDRYEDAASTYKRVLTLNPDYLPAHIHLAVAYVELEMEGEAKAEVEEILRLSPRFSSEAVVERFPFYSKHELERIVASLRRAGLR